MGHVPVDLQHIQAVRQDAQLLYSEMEVENSLKAMAEAIKNTIADENPVFLTVMNGGMIPASGLLRYLHFPLTMDYVHATRYQSSTQGYEISWKVRPSASLKDRTILIVDDILDGGITLGHIVAACQMVGARKILTAVLLEKRRARSQEAVQHADFVGLYVGDAYVFGYGMDYHEYLRNMPGIYAVDKRHLKQ